MTPQKLRRDVISAASGQAEQLTRGVVTGGNKVTIKTPPCCHPLFAYNQMVKSKCDISGIRFEKNNFSFNKFGL